jgi:hypothetical protein
MYGLISLTIAFSGNDSLSRVLSGSLPIPSTVRTVPMSHLGTTGSPPMYELTELDTKLLSSEGLTGRTNFSLSSTLSSYNPYVKRLVDCCVGVVCEMC